MMEQSKGKPITTSVPSIAIKYHANAEQIEELYGSDEENTEEYSIKSSSNSGSTNETDNSPLKYLRLVKRSTSIDVSSKNALDASPPSDPWRFFSDIKGKITKSVEDKITEIKSKHNDEGSPIKKGNKDKESKENSSVSDSEDISESSISKTCGILSTTEGAEMSSDDDETPSLDKDFNKKLEPSSSSSSLHHRFRVLKNKSPIKEGTLNKNVLKKLYNINTNIEQALPDDDNDNDDDVEHGVDALEETNLQKQNDDLIKKISQQFDNVKANNDFIEIEQVSGSEIIEKCNKTVFAPTGFVDLRHQPLTKKDKKNSRLILFVIIIILMIVYCCLHRYSLYLAGIVFGLFLGLFFSIIYNFLNSKIEIEIKEKPQIIEIAAVKEYQPLTKYEGWVNELPENYAPNTYHITKTQSVYLKLQGNFLRISHTNSKISKRAMWNEQKLKPNFTYHRIYNLLGAKVFLLPKGLTKKRLWSKKYPICIVLNEDQLNFDPFEEEEKEKKIEKKEEYDKNKKKGKIHFNLRKRSYPIMAQRFSKLTEEEEGEYEFDSEHSSPEISDENIIPPNIIIQEHQDDDADSCHSLPDEWTTFTSEGDSPFETKIYIFARTGREKEDWFRHLTAATHYKVDKCLKKEENLNMNYLKYMSMLMKSPSKEEHIDNENLWINLLIGRIMYDCLHDPQFTERIKDRIDRKLSTIKLPYFIEHLQVNAINLGQTTPIIHKFSKPQIDERGLWINLDITYEGLIILILQTKLNLMKLKQPQNEKNNKSDERPLAMFNSDIDDSAESSSEDEGLNWLQNTNQQSDQTTPTVTSKKFIKMVDKIAESKFFQVASEYHYIKKAMEEVSNTELRLKVEFRQLNGTAVLNIPPPPSDRIWIGFKPIPQLSVSAHPIVGARNINLVRVTSWIEKKLILEFQKYMVLPNMDDFVIDVMCPKLPE